MKLSNVVETFDEETLISFQPFLDTVIREPNVRRRRKKEEAKKVLRKYTKGAKSFVIIGSF